MGITEIDLTDPDKAKRFIRWARTNNIKYTLRPEGYIVDVQFNDIIQILTWT